MAAILRWRTRDVATVATMLNAGSTVRDIGSHFNVSRGAINSLMVRHELTGLSLHRSVAKIEPPPATPVRQNKFSNPPPMLVSCLRELPTESSPRAASFTQCEECFWPIGNGLWCNRARKFESYCARHYRRSIVPQV
jgi:hypothetical protein